MEVDKAYALISHAIDSGKLPGGYIVAGDLKGNCRELVERLLLKLFPDAQEQIKARFHPDVAFLEPEGRSRTIKTDTLRSAIVEPMAATSFSGGWKVGIVSSADRLQLSAANTFLKSLEEPTPKTLFILLTDRPDAIISTIVSRCQTIYLQLPKGVLEGDAAEKIAEVFSVRGMTGVYEKSQAAKYLAQLLQDLKDEAEDEDVPTVRQCFFNTVMSHVRGWMVSGLVPRHYAFRNVEAVEEAYARCERYIGEEAALSFMMDKLVFPGK